MATVVFWNPAVVYRPLWSAHVAALKTATKIAQAKAPRRSGKMAASIKGRPTSVDRGQISSSSRVALYQNYGTRAHEDAPKKAQALAGPSFGPVAHASIPAMAGKHFLNDGAASYPPAFQIAATGAFLKGLV